MLNTLLLINPLDLATGETGLDQLVKIFGFFFALFLLFFSFAIVIWTIDDVMSRTTNFWFQLFMTVLVMLFNIPGLVIYLLFRPSRTLSEESYDQLEQKMMDSSLSSHTQCPECQRDLQDDFLSCPNCHTEVKQQCTHCHKVLELDWSMCPYCKGKITPKHTTHPTHKVAPHKTLLADNS